MAQSEHLMSGPAIILVQPQLGENIGKTARAMLNFGLTDLRLVSPRDGWPNPDAGPSAAGADTVLDQAQVFDSVAAAVGDCHMVYATTVRSRDMPKTVVTPRHAASEIKSLAESGCRAAFLFGREASGLSNDDVSHAHKIVTAPINPAFGSLNLAQAVILVAYECFLAIAQAEDVQAHDQNDVAAAAETEGLHQQLVSELMARRYFRSEDRHAHQDRTLRNLIVKAGFSSQEIQTLRGVIKSLVRKSC